MKQNQRGALEDFEAHQIPEEWVQWLQFAREDAPEIEELQANRAALDERLRKAKEFDAHDKALQIQEKASRGPGDGEYSTAFEQRNILAKETQTERRIRLDAEAKESEEERRIRHASAEARPTGSSWGGAPTR